MGKITEMFEGENSSLRKTFDEAVKPENKCEEHDEVDCTNCPTVKNGYIGELIGITKGMPPKPEESRGWELRFDENFPSPDGQDFMDTVRISSVKSFIKNLLLSKETEVREWLRETIKTLGKDQIELYGGKLPFVVFNGKADENEKIEIYRQALNDVFKLNNL